MRVDGENATHARQKQCLVPRRALFDHTQYQTTEFVHILFSAVVCYSFDTNPSDSKKKTGIQAVKKIRDSQEILCCVRARHSRVVVG
jgi:hypothetical protein